MMNVSVDSMQGVVKLKSGLRRFKAWKGFK